MADRTRRRGGARCSGAGVQPAALERAPPAGCSRAQLAHSACPPEQRRPTASARPRCGRSLGLRDSCITRAQAGSIGDRCGGLRDHQGLVDASRPRGELGHEAARSGSAARHPQSRSLLRAQAAAAPRIAGPLSRSATGPQHRGPSPPSRDRCCGARARVRVRRRRTGNAVDRCRRVTRRRAGRCPCRCSTTRAGFYTQTAFATCLTAL